jgi:hypothetical protein
VTGSAWTTADYALVISLFSAVLAVASFVWSIWSHFIFPKAKIRVWADIQYLNRNNYHSASIRADSSFAADMNPDEMELPTVSVTISNFGPGEVIVTNGLMSLKRGHPRKKDGHAIIIAYQSYPDDLTGNRLNSGGLPAELVVGQTLRLNYPVCDEWFENGAMNKLGVTDTFNRHHWASTKNMKWLLKQYDAHTKLQAKMR